MAYVLSKGMRQRRVHRTQMVSNNSARWQCKVFVERCAPGVSGAHAKPQAQVVLAWQAVVPKDHLQVSEDVRTVERANMLYIVNAVLSHNGFL